MSYARQLRVVVWLVLACITSWAWAEPVTQPLEVIYPRPESSRDARADYPLELLRLALERSDVPYDLKPSAVAMQQSRSLRQLAKGESLDIAWSVTTRQREKGLLPIRIPIDRGLIGWRVLMIRPDEQARMDTIHSAAGLAPLWSGQGHDWPDLPILQASGLKVVASPTYEGLFNMLAKGRIDYFPRSIAEAERELGQHPKLDLTIEKHLLLHYPSALYFFVNPHNQALADAVTRGLERAIADGSMRKLFRETYGSVTRDLDLAHRTVIELPNPNFPDDAPTGRPELWFQPTESP